MIGNRFIWWKLQAKKQDTMIYRNTHHLSEKEETTRMLVFNVKSSGAFWPSVQLSLQKSLEKVDEALLNLSEDADGKLETAVVSRAARPFNALSYTITEKQKTKK